VTPFALGVGLLAAGFVLGLGIARVAEHDDEIWLLALALAVNAAAVGVLLAALWSAS
jgi:hypothetical protein